MREMKMQRQTKAARSGGSHRWLALVLMAAGIIGSRQVSAASSDRAQTTFATPAAAGRALLTAARRQDEKALGKILGPDSLAVLDSGDASEDKAALESFVSKFDQMNRWTKMKDGSEVLNIGADNYAFPFPLVQGDSAKWYFDSEAGKEEILARRIGRNELLAIDALYAIANAEEQYAQQSRDGNPAGIYTTKIFSTSGKQDGLYWPAAEDEPASPLGRVELFAKEALSTPNESPVIDGYSFRILTAESDQVKGVMQYIVNGKMTGGFAVIASPLKYGDSGIMTFIINRDGVVYQHDLGPNTQKVAAFIAEYNPTDSWVPAE
jgi:hypothetical protein